MPIGMPGFDSPFGGWPQRNVRASDADREKAVDMLRQHAGDGRITMEELSDRTGYAYNAGTLGELDALVRDLPRPTQGVQVGQPVHGRPSGAMAGLARPRRLRYAIVRYGIVDGACVVIWSLTGGPSHGFGDFWPVWPIVGGFAWLGLKAVRRAERQHRADSFTSDIQRLFPNFRSQRRPR